MGVNAIWQVRFDGQLFIRSIALILLPQKFDDEDGWGDEKRIQSGLNVDFDDGRIKTSRRWNNVNHGSWLQGSGELADPEKTFSLRATHLPDPDDKTQRYEVNLSAKLNVSGRQQQWNYGVMLWSISVDATADISIQATFDVKSEVVTTDKGSRLRFVPNVTQATAHLNNFKLHRISHAKGTAVKGIGELVEELLQLRLKRENKDFAARINAVTADDLVRVARKYIDLAHLNIVIVGDKATVEGPLRATGIAPVAILDPEGRPVIVP